MMNFNTPANETPEQAAVRKRQAVAGVLMGPQQMPQNVGQGIEALGKAMMYRQQKQNTAFPAAPGGKQAGFGTLLKNIFTGGHNGGFY